MQCCRGYLFGVFRLIEERLGWLGSVLRMEDCWIPEEAINWNLSNTSQEPGRAWKSQPAGHHPKRFKRHRIDLGLKEMD